ncbi:hypothetical protein SDC9_178264 [bioreactor metagenome]|uniref:Uncharacterized protein n=1 Tax=bioreactor metagenome TaxID=1076179 RepID=A0A645H4N1_9ZZZZ
MKTSQLQESFRKYGSISRSLTGATAVCLAGFQIKGGNAMKGGGVFYCRFITSAFFRHHVEHYGPLDFFNMLQHLNEAVQIMAVHRAIILKA